MHVHHGKGALDRYVPLPDAMLTLLRKFWRTHRNPLWLFPATPKSRSKTPGPISRSSLQSAFVRAVRQCGIRKQAHVHTLRTATLHTCSKRVSHCN